MASFAAPAMMISSAISAAGQIKSGRAQRDQYRREADLAQLKGRTEAIAYKQKGADILSNLNNTLAAIIARSAAGGVDPTSGSSAVLAKRRIIRA